jgi:NAD-dependent deacetylase
MILTGAHISAESGLPTFRGAGGLWRGHDAASVAIPEAFAADPAKVAVFYDDRGGPLPRLPHQTLRMTMSPGHNNLEGRSGDRDDICRWYLQKCWCRQCPASARSPQCCVVHRLWRDPGRTDGIIVAMKCPKLYRCGDPQARRGILRQMPQFLDEAFAAARRSVVLVVVGCGGTVAPASLLPRQAAVSGTYSTKLIWCPRHHGCRPRGECIGGGGGARPQAVLGLARPAGKGIRLEVFVGARRRHRPVAAMNGRGATSNGVRSDRDIPKRTER